MDTATPTLEVTSTWAERNGLAFEPQGHLYTLRGQPVPALSRVLEAAGLSSAWKIKPEYLERGSAVHAVTEYFDTDDLELERGADGEWEFPGTDPRLWGRARAYIRFREETGFEPDRIEQMYASPTYRYALRLDRAGVRNRERWLVEIKSGDPGPSVDIQLALQDHALAECEGVQSDRLIELILSDDGRYKMRESKQSRAYNLAIGLAAVSLYHWRKSNGKL